MQEEQPGSPTTDPPSLDDLKHEIALLRRTLLKHGHAQELFQGRVEHTMERVVKGLTSSAEEKPASSASTRSATGGGFGTGGLGKAQLRSLVELAQAVRTLKDLATREPSTAPEDEDSPRSLREGLDLLGIRVSNLQRSFGLEPIPALGKPFDDRLHRAHGVCQRSDLPDGQVVEELLPGFLLHGEVERPALVIVNQMAADRPQEEEHETMRDTRP